MICSFAPRIITEHNLKHQKVKNFIKKKKNYRFNILNIN